MSKLTRDGMVHLLKKAGACAESLDLIQLMREDVTPWEVWQAISQFDWVAWVVDHDIVLRVKVIRRVRTRLYESGMIQDYKNKWELEISEDDDVNAAHAAKTRWQFAARRRLQQLHQTFDLFELVESVQHVAGMMYSPFMIVEEIKSVVGRDEFDTLCNKIVALACREQRDEEAHNESMDAMLSNQASRAYRAQAKAQENPDDE
jgi:hypothetical protein